MAEIEAVTFDYYQHADPRGGWPTAGAPARSLAGPLEEADFALERVRLEAVFDAAMDAHIASWRANQQLRFAEAAEHCLEELGFDAPTDVRPTPVDDLYGDAPLCYTCGVKMQRAGSCHVCSSCGATSGCSRRDVEGFTGKGYRGEPSLTKRRLTTGRRKRQHARQAAHRCGCNGWRVWISRPGAG